MGLKGLFLLPTCHSKRVRQRVMCVQCFIRGGGGRGEGTGGP